MGYPYRRHDIGIAKISKYNNTSEYIDCIWGIVGGVWFVFWVSRCGFFMVEGGYLLLETSKICHLIMEK